MKSPWRSPLYAILDLPHRGGLSLGQAGRALIAGGCGVLQLRAKGGFDSSLSSMREETDALAELVQLSRAKGVPLIINDDLQLAQNLAESFQDGVVGLHLGQEDLAELRSERGADHEPEGYWGLSTHNLEQVGKSGRSTASYLGFGPVYATSTKIDADPVAGLETLGRACRASLHPLVAIGGITDGGRGSDCLAAGAAAVASVSALIADSPIRVEARCSELLAELMMR